MKFQAFFSNGIFPMIIECATWEIALRNALAFETQSSKLINIVKTYDIHDTSL